jgi:hypothetical protein
MGDIKISKKKPIAKGTKKIVKKITNIAIEE